MPASLGDLCNLQHKLKDWLPWKAKPTRTVRWRKKNLFSPIFQSQPSFSPVKWTDNSRPALSECSVNHKTMDIDYHKVSEFSYKFFFLFWQAWRLCSMYSCDRELTSYLCTFREQDEYEYTMYVYSIYLTGHTWLAGNINWNSEKNVRIYTALYCIII